MAPNRLPTRMPNGSQKPRLSVGKTRFSMNRQQHHNVPAPAPGKTTRPQRKTYTTRTLRSSISGKKICATRAAVSIPGNRCNWRAACGKCNQNLVPCAPAAGAARGVPLVVRVLVLDPDAPRRVEQQQALPVLYLLGIFQAYMLGVLQAYMLEILGTAWRHRRLAFSGSPRMPKTCGTTRAPLSCGDCGVALFQGRLGHVAVAVVAGD